MSRGFFVNVPCNGGLFPDIILLTPCGSIHVDCGLVPSNGLTMIGVFFLNFSTDSCQYLLIHLLLT